jgi:CDGSH-type Zn-finger protein
MRLPEPRVVAALVAGDDRVPSATVSGFLQRRATREQFTGFVIHRSVYHLKKASFTILTPDGERIEPGRGSVALCPCAKSASKPFCDGSRIHPRILEGE